MKANGTLGGGVWGGRSPPSRKKKFEGSEGRHAMEKTGILSLFLPVAVANASGLGANSGTLY